LIDTNVVSEARKRANADAGVRAFFDSAIADNTPLYLPAISLGELRRGVELVRYRGDVALAARLEAWLGLILEEFADRVLDFGPDAAQVWGRLRVPRADHPLDKQIAAIALVHDLTVVTRNVADFVGTGARVLNPFGA
jgi:predicted nucleic acid-binding protein